MTTTATPVNGFPFPTANPVFPTTGPFPGTVTVQPAIWKPTQRPAFTVHQKLASGTVIRYDANHLAYAIHNGKYVVTFISSGHMTIVPAGEIEKIEFHAFGAHFCGQCDHGLASWPANDPAYAGSNPVTVTFLGNAGTASGETIL